MGEVTDPPRIEKPPIVAKLRKANPQAPLATILMYVDAFVDYQEAQSNLDRHGAIVLHPRTGAPIENPYFKIRDSAGAKLAKFRLKADCVWTRDEQPAKPAQTPAQPTKITRPKAAGPAARRNVVSKHAADWKKT